MGAVYEVFDQVRGERVALKVLLQVTAAGIQRFKREFHALADLTHPNLASLYELMSAGNDWLLTCPPSRPSAARNPALGPTAEG
jgi:eukaryotic-like serine/threonine-protein kinase